MKMTITSYFQDEAGQVVGGRTVCNMGESGWPDLLTFQRDRLSYFRDHARERAELTPCGINVVERRPSLGLLRVQEVELS